MVDLLQRKRQPGQAPAPSAVAAGQPAAPPAAAPVQRGSGFVGFDRYFSANQAGAQSMAQTVGDKVQQRGQEGAGALQAGQDAFASKSAAANLPFNPLRASTSEEAKKLAATTYTGPKNWAEAGVDTAAVAKKTQAGTSAAQALGSAGGVASLLREDYRSPVTAGASSLDAALTGAAGGGRFQQLQQLYGDLDKRLVTAQGAAGDTYAANLAGTKEAAGKYGELAGTLAEQERLAAEQQAQVRGDAAAREVETRQRRADLMDGQWSQDEANTLEDFKRGGAGSRVARPKVGRAYTRER